MVDALVIPLVLSGVLLGTPLGHEEVADDEALGSSAEVPHEDRALALICADLQDVTCDLPFSLVLVDPTHDERINQQQPPRYLIHTLQVARHGRIVWIHESSSSQVPV